jgi:hypothetical protein
MKRYEEKTPAAFWLSLFLHNTKTTLHILLQKDMPSVISHRNLKCYF